MIETLAKTIVWLAEERLAKEEGQNLNSAIHAVAMEIDLYIMNKFMKEQKEND